jgi:uncharacterized membrane protein
MNLEIVANDKVFPNIKELFSMCLTFLLAAFAFIFFRAESIGDALLYIEKIFSGSLLTRPEIGSAVDKLAIGSMILSIPVLMIGEWINRREEYGFKIQSRRKIERWLVYTTIAMIILELAGQGEGFVYFQF